MVIVSGSTISRAIFSFDSWCPCPFRRWVRRRNAATERVRSSSAAVAVVTVSRPRLRCSEPRVGRAVGSITLPAGAETATRLFFRLPLEIGFLGATLFFVALAGLGGFTLGLLARLTLASGFGL